MTTAIVVAGGLSPDPGISDSLPSTGNVIVADSGLDHALELGLEPMLLVGDLDSISAEGLQWARDHQVPIESHPTDKDETDLDLAITAAARLADNIVVIDAGLGRLDHSLANLLLLASDRFSEVEVSAFVGDGFVTVVRNTRSLSGKLGDRLSLVALGGPAAGVSTAGLRWQLVAATLEAGSTWGVSNEFVERAARVSVDTGVVLAIQPERPPIRS
jgi:thiamine pyrophosphokinase